MNYSNIFFLLLLIVSSCSTHNNKHHDTSDQQPISLMDDIHYKGAPASKMEIDTSLSHQMGFACDSALGIDYIGFSGEHSYMALNNKGQYINSIKNKRKLSDSQFKKLQSILGDSLTYKNPRIVACYEPRLAFVYFKDGKIIGQTQICISCAQLYSTAKIFDNNHGELFNTKATQQLDSLRIELGLNSKMPWE